MSLPFLDIRVLKQNPKQFVEKLRSACHNIGFFLLKHDLPPGVAERQLSETRNFFQHPLSQKRSISYEDNATFRGYMEIGRENTAGVTDTREQVEYAAEECGMSGRPWPPYERLRGGNPWPAFQPNLQTQTNEYVDGVLDLAVRLREAMCLSLGMENNALDALFGKTPHWQLKLISYPPIPSADDTNDVAKEQRGSNKGQGVGAHTDSNFLTFVLQDTIGGLQVFSRGRWLNVPATGPDVLVCNLGEQTEILSNGYFLATPHRVIRNSTKEPRTSVPIFYNPQLSAKISPMMLPDGGKSLPWERSSNDNKHWRMNNNDMLETVGENSFKSLARSHPFVFQRHHKDLRLLENGKIVPSGDS